MNFRTRVRSTRAASGRVIFDSTRDEILSFEQFECRRKEGRAEGKEEKNQMKQRITRRILSDERKARRRERTTSENSD